MPTTKEYTIHLGFPPPVVQADNAEDAIVKLREYMKEQFGEYLPVPLTVRVTADDFDMEVTA